MSFRKTEIPLALAALLGLPGLLPAQVEPVFDSRGIPYTAIDAEACLGRVRAVNRPYNFLVVSLFRRSQVEPGRYVALRRAGVIVCFACVEAVEPGSVATLEILPESTGFHPITLPAVGDEVIWIPEYGRGPDSPPDF